MEQQEGITWAPAFYIQGDKVSFYRCGFIGIQDTLTDWQGRHYFESCYIEGAIDFIWGGGQSIYQVNLIPHAYIYHISFTNTNGKFILRMHISKLYDEIKIIFWYISFLDIYNFFLKTCINTTKARIIDNVSFYQDSDSRNVNTPKF